MGVENEKPTYGRVGYGDCRSLLDFPKHKPALRRCDSNDMRGGLEEISSLRWWPLARHCLHRNHTRTSSKPCQLGGYAADCAYTLFRSDGVPFADCIIRCMDLAEASLQNSLSPS